MRAFSWFLLHIIVNVVFATQQNEPKAPMQSLSTPNEVTADWLPEFAQTNRFKRNGWMPYYNYPAIPKPSPQYIRSFEQYPLGHIKGSPVDLILSELIFRYFKPKKFLSLTEAFKNTSHHDLIWYSTLFVIHNRFDLAEKIENELDVIPDYRLWFICDRLAKLNNTRAIYLRQWLNDRKEKYLQQLEAEPRPDETQCNALLKGLRPGNAGHKIFTVSANMNKISASIYHHCLPLDATFVELRDISFSRMQSMLTVWLMSRTRIESLSIYGLSMENQEDLVYGSDIKRVIFGN